MYLSFLKFVSSQIMSHKCYLFCGVYNIHFVVWRIWIHARKFHFGMEGGGGGAKQYPFIFKKRSQTEYDGIFHVSLV